MGQACILCGATAAEAVSELDRHGRPLRTVLCTGCGFIRNDPVPTQEELDRFYAVQYRRDYKGTPRPRRRQVFRNFRRLEQHMGKFSDVYARGGRWLDLGAGSGEFAFLAHQIGAHVTAVEPNEDYADYCRNDLGLSVQTATLESCNVVGPFDLIRLNHVLEHMRDPIDTLRRLAALLAEDGLLYVEVPDIADEAARKLRGRLFHYGHINNFDPVTLRHAAWLCGLVEAEITAARCAGTTGIFLAKGSGAVTSPAGLAENAARNRAAMADHIRRTVPRPAKGNAAGRFLAHLRARLAEQIATAHGPAYGAIGTASALRLKVRLGPVGGIVQPV